MTINKGQANIIDVTVTEMTTISSPYYLIEFYSDSNKDYTYCILPSNQSTAIQKRRFDKFTITEKTSPNNLLGEIELREGDYKYTIYQQSSSTNLNPSNTTPGLSFAYVEIGKATVKGTDTPETEYDGATLTNTTYEP